MWRNYKRLLPFAKPFRGYFVVATIFNILTAAASTVVITSLLPAMSVLLDEAPKAGESKPSLFGGDLFSKNSFLDSFSGFFQHGTRVESLARICLFIFIIYGLKNLFQYIANYLMALVEGGINKSLRDTIIEKLTTLSLDYFYDRKMGHLIVRVTDDVGVVNGMLTSSMTTLTREPISILGYLYVLFTISPKMMMIGAAIAVASLVTINFFGKTLKRYAHNVQEKIGGFITIAQELISGIKVVKSFSMESYEVSRFKEETARHYKFSRRLTRIRNLIGPLNEMLAIIGFIGILWFGGNEVFAKEMKGSQLFFFLITLITLLQPVRTLSEVLSRMNEGGAAAENIYTVLDATASVPTGQLAAPSTHSLPIVFDSVSFQYKNTTDYALNGITLDIRPNEVLALVGSSGAGKTTFVDLLARFYDPTSGSIQLGGNDLRNYDLVSLRKLFGIVTQDTVLFHDTIYNNIAYGNRAATKEMVYEAAKAANAHAFIMASTNGYETIAGDRGVRLSGGQRQRIAIARALLKNPPILIFDEATSALDTENEMLVQQAIENLLKERTAVVIAHRLSTIQNADRIAVFDKGSVVELGTHDELIMNTDGIYHRLYSIQTRAASEGLVELRS